MSLLLLDFIMLIVHFMAMICTFYSCILLLLTIVDVLCSACTYFMFLTLSIGHLDFPEEINKIYLSVYLTGYRQSGFKPYRDALNNHLFKFGYRGIYITLLIM